MQSLKTGIKMGGLELLSSGFQIQTGPDELRESEAEGSGTCCLRKGGVGAERRGQEEFSQINLTMLEAPRACEICLKV